MPYPTSIFQPCSPGNTIIPETESQVSSQNSISDHSPIFPTSESQWGLDEDGVGRQKLVAEIPLDRIGATPERLINVSKRLQRLENDNRFQHGNKENDSVHTMDVSSEINSNIGHETEEREDTLTLVIAMELIKELRKSIKELRVMYEMMQENHEVRKKEEAIRLTAYGDILHSLTSRDYCEL